MKQYDFLIVGAGLSGLAAANILHSQGKSCLIVEKRKQIGGNVHDYELEGCNVHAYGAHLFHTNSRAVWEFVNRLTDWKQYEHRVKVLSQGEVFSFPPNMATYQQLGLKLDDPSFKAIIMRRFFSGYSRKHWGVDLDMVPRTTISRIPIRHNWDDRYFSDRWQAIPAYGYRHLAKRMAEGIDVETQVDFNRDRDHLRSKAKHMIYTGPVDELYENMFGPLPYRSLVFSTELQQDPFPAPTLNYSDESEPRLRTINWSLIGWGKRKQTGPVPITHEVAVDYDGTNEPLYPVRSTKGSDIYNYYRKQAERDGVTLCGRLGAFQYLNMDQAISSGMKAAKHNLLKLI